MAAINIAGSIITNGHVAPVGRGTLITRSTNPLVWDLVPGEIVFDVNRGGGGGTIPGGAHNVLEAGQLQDFYTYVSNKSEITGEKIGDFRGKLLKIKINTEINGVEGEKEFNIPKGKRNARFFIGTVRANENVKFMVSAQNVRATSTPDIQVNVNTIKVTPGRGK